MIKFLKNHPMVLIDGKFLVLSELHLGFEKELNNKGILLPSQTEKFAKIIRKACVKTKAKKLIIIGDVKHRIFGVGRKDLKEVLKFFNFLEKFVDVIVVKGNHDSGLEKILKIKIYGSRGLKIGKYGFFHGHAKPYKELMECDFLFTSHLHPCLKLGNNIFRVWVKSKIEKEKVMKEYKIKKVGKLNLIVLPTFNPFLGGILLNKEKAEIFNLVNFNDSEIYLLDGTFLGKLKDLR